jgi:hypothetical protein
VFALEVHAGNELVAIEAIGLLTDLLPWKCSVLHYTDKVCFAVRRHRLQAAVVGLGLQFLDRVKNDTYVPLDTYVRLIRDALYHHAHVPQIVSHAISILAFLAEHGPNRPHLVEFVPFVAAAVGDTGTGTDNGAHLFLNVIMTRRQRLVRSIKNLVCC